MFIMPKIVKTWQDIIIVRQSKVKNFNLNKKNVEQKIKSINTIYSHQFIMKILLFIKNNFLWVLLMFFPFL